jgi:hypothetical protein
MQSAAEAAPPCLTVACTLCNTLYYYCCCMYCTYRLVSTSLVTQPTQLVSTLLPSSRCSRRTRLQRSVLSAAPHSQSLQHYTAYDMTNTHNVLPAALAVPAAFEQLQHSVSSTTKCAAVSPWLTNCYAVLQSRHECLPRLLINISRTMCRVRLAQTACASCVLAT